ncbi:MAG TPA: sigma-54 dependent transcriptional regulator [Candidatus Acidoferrales bacterium]|nr:sigma-54 dependent transcriptional regulator [Candidatus Acidoferrales bacterium]
MTVTTEHPVAQLARQALSICVLDDEPDLVECTIGKLRGLGYSATGTTNANEALGQVRAGACRMMLVDMLMPEMDGFTFLEKSLQLDPNVAVVLVTGRYTVDSAIEAIKRGAYDYLCKPLDEQRLRKSLDELTEMSSRRSQIRVLDEQLLSNFECAGIVGRSPAMLEMLDMVRKIAKHYTNVLISGATGSGKELVARALHQMSQVGQQRFAVCNCSALVDTLLESQLFGHMRGAFTGATETRPGLFEYANGGTVFLDEVSETSLQMQAKLLRVIQNREIQRVGSPQVMKVDVRIITATNRDLRSEVLAGRFREDLFYRLSSLEIRVPGLVERAEDIPILVRYFLKKYSDEYGKTFQGLTRRAQMVLLHHDWPGNVRELENVISSAAITATNEFIDVDDLPGNLRRPSGDIGPVQENWRPLPLDEMRRIHIKRVLEMCGGNRVRAAQVLGIGRTSLYRFLKREHRHASSKTAA